MRIPGFTAEAALYKPSGYYNATTDGAALTTQIVPQQACPLPGVCNKACNLCPGPSNPL